MYYFHICFSCRLKKSKQTFKTKFVIQCSVQMTWTRHYYLTLFPWRGILFIPMIVYHMTKPGGKRVNYHWYQERFLVNNSVMAEDVYSKTFSRISVRNSDWRNHMTEISSEFRYRLLLCKINFLRRNFVTKVDNNNSNFKFRPEFYSNSSRLW